MATLNLDNYKKKPINLGSYKKSSGPFRYDVPDLETRDQKIQRFNQEATQSAEEARKANSFPGKAKNFGKAVGGTLLNSQIGLGQTLAKLRGPDKNVMQAQESMSATQLELVKRISEKSKRGEDTTKLKQLYNANAAELKKLGANLDEYNESLPSNLKAAGQIGGTALDLLTAGTYGKATTAMQSGKLFRPASNQALQATARHLSTADDVLKNVSTKNLADLGGEPALVKNTATNIVDGLKASGFDRVSQRVAALDPSKYATLAEYSADVARLFPEKGALKTLATASGLPELGQLATQKASGLFTRQGAGNVLKGASIGYGYDVTQGLQGARGEDREGSKAFIPGAGTAFGATIPLLNETATSIKNARDPNVKARNLATKRGKALDQMDTYKQISTAVDKGKQRGIDIKKVLSETDVLHGAVDPDGRITTLGDDGAVAQYTRQYIDGNEDIVSDLLKKEGRSISSDVIKKKLKKAIMDSGIEGANLERALKKIDNEMAGLSRRASGEGVIPVETLHRAKIDKYDSINFFTDASKSKYEKTIARAMKELVEENTKSADIAAINKDLSKHFAVIDYLKKLDGKRVKGGRLGKYFSQTIGAIVGGQAGGPIGAIVGAEAGGMYQGGAMSRVFNGKTGRVLPRSEVMRNAENVRDAAPLQLPQSSRSVGNRQTNQAPTITNTSNTGISDTIQDVDNGASALSTNKKLAAFRAGDAPKEGGYLRLPRTAKPKSGSSSKFIRLSPKGKEVVQAFLAHVDGSKKLQGDDLARVRQQAQAIGDRIGAPTLGRDGTLADFLADYYTKQRRQ